MAKESDNLKKLNEIANSKSTMLDHQMDRIRINIARKMINWTQEKNLSIPRWTD
jgi:hypothetical protein